MPYSKTNSKQTTGLNVKEKREKFQKVKKENTFMISATEISFKQRRQKGKD